MELLSEEIICYHGYLSSHRQVLPLGTEKPESTVT